MVEFVDADKPPNKLIVARTTPPSINDQYPDAPNISIDINIPTEEPGVKPRLRAVEGNQFVLDSLSGVMNLLDVASVIRSSFDLDGIQLSEDLLGGQ